MAITDSILTRNTYPPLIRTALWLKTDILIVGKEDYQTASLLLEQIPLLPQKDDSLSYYECKALLLETQGRHKEANRLFDMAETLVSDNLDSLTLLNYKSEAYRLRKDYKSAFNALRKATEIQYTEIQTLLGQSVTHAMEKYYRESLEKEKERSISQRKIYALSLALLSFMIIGLILFARKLHLDRVQDMADIESLGNDLLALQAKNTFFRKTADSVIIDKVQFLQRLSESYFSWTDEEVKKREKQKGIQTKDELISVFRQQLGEIRSNKQLIVSLEGAVNTSNDNLIQRLRSEYKDKLKEQDFSTLTMLYSGLSVKSIAFYLRTTEPALRTRKTRYKHLFEENPTPSSAEFIQRLTPGDTSLRSE
jgi:cell division protein FtsB